jgi:predicted MFS family arabinose efflux permease
MSMPIIDVAKADSFDRRVLCGACAAGTIGLLPVWVVPQVVFQLSTTWKFSLERAGILGTLELLACGLTTLLMGLLPIRLPHRSLALAAGVVLVAAQLASFYSATAEVTVWLLRALSGVAAGVIYGMMAPIAALHRFPDKVFAAMIFVSTGVGSLALAALPLWLIWTEPRLLFVGLALFNAVFVPLLILLPQGTAQPRVQKTLRWLHAPVVLYALAGLGILWLGIGAFWAFSEQLAQRVEFDTKQVGMLLSCAALAGLIGASAAGMLAKNTERKIPLLLGVLFCGCATALCLLPFASLFAAGVLGQGMVITFIQTVVLGIATAVDGSGRFGSAAAATALLANGLGPWLGGALYASAGDLLVVSFASVACLAAALLLWRFCVLAKT